MKKTLLLTTLLLSSTSYANMYVKGGFNYAKTKLSIDDSSHAFARDSGVIDEQGLGIKLGFGYNISDSVAFELGLEKDEISISYGFGMNVRLYNTNKFNFYTTLNVEQISYDNDILYAETMTGGMNPGIRPFKYTFLETDASMIAIGFEIDYKLNENYSVYSSLKRTEYGEIRANEVTPLTGTSTDFDFGIAPNTKMEVGVKYKF